MDSGFQILRTSTVIIDWQNQRSLSSSFTFQRSGLQVRKVATLWTGCRSQQSHVCFASYWGSCRGEKHEHRLPVSASIQSSGRELHVDEAESIECLWEKYFADPSQWWDNTITKKHYRAPDFKHKVTGEALWIFNPFTPQWVKTMPAGRKHLSASGVRSLCGPSQLTRLPKYNEKGYPRPEWARSGSDKHMQTRDRVAILKKKLQQGITIHANIYLGILQRCFKQKDLTSAKQVHDCIRNTGMEQNPYVANYLLKVYIRCGRLQDARQLFDKLGTKNVFNWTTMIGGYAENHNHAKDALEVYNDMRQAGEQPNEITYLSILKACAGPGGYSGAEESTPTSNMAAFNQMCV